MRAAKLKKRAEYIPALERATTAMLQAWGKKDAQKRIHRAFETFCRRPIQLPKGRLLLRRGRRA
jgi:hypothetical protein